MGIGFLYNEKEGFAYPKGKLFDARDEYNEALLTGWDTGPADKAKAAKAKADEAEVKEEVEEVEAEEETPNLPEEEVEEVEEVKKKAKSKPKSRRRKK